MQDLGDTNLARVANQLGVPEIILLKAFEIYLERLGIKPNFTVKI